MLTRCNVCGEFVPTSEMAIQGTTKSSFCIKCNAEIDEKAYLVKEKRWVTIPEYHEWLKQHTFERRHEEEKEEMQQRDIVLKGIERNWALKRRDHMFRIMKRRCCDECGLTRLNNLRFVFRGLGHQRAIMKAWKHHRKVIRREARVLCEWCYRKWKLTAPPRNKIWDGKKLKSDFFSPEFQSTFRTYKPHPIPTSVAKEIPDDRFDALDRIDKRERDDGKSANTHVS